MNEFYQRWQNRSDELSDTQAFWLDILHDFLRIDNPAQYIEFQKRVELSHVSFIDAYIPSTKIIIEQKSGSIDLDKEQTQSDGTNITPFQQAKRYYDWLPASQRGRYIVVCNFHELRIYDMETPKAEPKILTLGQLSPENLAFLVKAERELSREEIISMAAGELAAKLYNSLLKRYKDSKDKAALRSLNIFCVRIVFLLYAEDSGTDNKNTRIFSKSQFHDYLKAHANTARTSLIELFKVLATEIDKRDPYLDDDLAALPYINGGLFEEEIEIPKLDGEPLKIILEEMSEGFDWSEINPTIFGAIFESTLNPETRKLGGMHYTSIANIHRVIDPLFLDELNAEFESIFSGTTSPGLPLRRGGESKVSRTKKLIAFQDKLSSLTFLDPACGSGNFLTETYLSLRRLENRIIEALSGGQRYFVQGTLSPIKVSISQFYGIEVNDFAVAVARTALWIAEHQMMRETHKIAEFYDDFLPLKTSCHIVEDNAIRIDWAAMISPAQLSYIISNPPFYGHQWRKEGQITDMDLSFHDLPEHGKLDYVCAWYNKAADFMNGTHIKAAFVSTNSIFQGESVSTFWQFMRGKGIDIFFVYRPFMWENEAKEKAHVHCAIAAISRDDITPKYIYSINDGQVSRTAAQHINGYLLDAPDMYITNRGRQVNPGLPSMRKGSQPTDGGNLILSADERGGILAKYPEAEDLIRRYMGGRDFLYDNVRYCIWLAGVEPGRYRHIRPIMSRLEKVAEARRKSSTKSVQEAAESPGLFTQIRQPESGSLLIIPRVSSEDRKYIPIDFISSEVIVSDAVQFIPDADLYMFGVLTSSIHMAWVKVVAGRLEMRYRYSPFVYNCFVFPEADDKQRARIEKTAGGILSARGRCPASTLADMYDPLTMPVELRRAHRANDEAVREAYGFAKGISEFETVSRLMEMYTARVRDVIQ